MNSKELVKGKILELVGKLNEQEQKAFVWRCTIRILPFIDTSESLDFWKNASGAFKEIFEALDLMSYGGIYTEKIIRNKITKNHEGASEELEEKIKVKTKEVFMKIASNISNTIQELNYLESSIDTEIPEAYKERFDNEQHFYDFNYDDDLIEAISQTYKIIGVLSIAANIFRDTVLDDINNNNIEPLINNIIDIEDILEYDINHKTLNGVEDLLKYGMSNEELKDLEFLLKGKAIGQFHAKNTVKFDISNRILNDLVTVSNGQKPMFSEEYNASSMLSSFIHVIEHIGLKKDAKFYQQITKKHFEMDIEVLEKRIDGILF